MMKLADAGGWVWLIIIVVASLAKGWSKLMESKGDQSPEPDDSPLPSQPRRAVPYPQPRPASLRCGELTPFLSLSHPSMKA